MHTKELINRFFRRVNGGRATGMVVIASLALGAVAGTIAAVACGGAEQSAIAENMQRVFSAYSLQSVNKGEVFRIALYNNFKSLFLLWLSGLNLFLIPLTLLQLGTKGFKFAFTAAFLTKIYRWKGALFVFASMLPKNMIAIPLFLLYAVFLIRRAGESYRLKGKSDTKEAKKRLYLSGFRMLAVMLLLLTACSALDAYLVPVVVRPICSMMI